MERKTGFVYQINNLIIPDRIYVGSTFKPLEIRFKNHKDRCLYQKSRSHYPLYEDMLKYGIENFEIKQIEVIEDCEKNQLLKIEGKYQKELKPYYNLRRAGRNSQEYYEDNRSSISEKMKLYYSKNKEEIIRKQQEHYDLNQEFILEKKKEYYQNNITGLQEKGRTYYCNNKEKVLESKSKTFICPCDLSKEIRQGEKARHFRTKKHLRFTETHK